MNRDIKNQAAKIDKLQAKLEPLLAQLDAAQKTKLKLAANRQDMLTGIQMLAARLRGDLDPIELGELLNSYLK